MRSPLHLMSPAASVTFFRRARGSCPLAAGIRRGRMAEIAFFPPHGASCDADRKASGGVSSLAPITLLSATRLPVRSAQLIRSAIALLIALVAAVFCTPERAQAAQVTATIRGTVISGTDYTGTFGLGKGASLVGHPYTLVYTMDDTKGVPLYGTWPNCNNGLQNSGLNNTPVPRAVLTINGQSWAFGTFAHSDWVSSWVSSTTATNPQTDLSFGIRNSYNLESSRGYTDTKLYSATYTRIAYLPYAATGKVLLPTR